MTKKKELSEAELDRRRQLEMEKSGETWDLEIVLSGAAVEQIVLAKLAGFRRRSDLKPATKRKVIEAARAVIAELERQGKLGDVTHSGKGKRL
jgi:hypothetical protein